LCLKRGWSDFDPQAYYLYGEDQNHERSFKGKALQAVVDSWCKIQVVFHSNRSGKQDIWVMDADGSDQTQITPIPGDEQHADWSPDGTKIAPRSRRSDNCDIWIYYFYLKFIDIKPASDINCLNINGNGVIPIAILGSGDFNVSAIDLDEP
jgi:dipeptidyl aminopeptidase/acylaminoacyl peptidase